MGWGWIYGSFRQILPKISSSEMIALKSGTVSIDREIMSGLVTTKPIKSVISDIEYKYLNENVPDMIRSVGGAKMADGDRLTPVVEEVVKKNRAFAYIIPEEYGGWGFSVEAQSRILSKLASANPGFAVTVMVPNSLSVAEILLKDFGTRVQKDYYLPKLSSCELIPCFGLTGPNNGSDALGSLDKGYIEGNKIVADIDKRYITLAPVASCIGVAIDVDGYGPTLVICTPEMIPERKVHDPLGCGFPNGVLRGRIEVPKENVIGEIGNGWAYLMECLASGRGVSLPASSLGPAIAATYGIQGYSKLRTQFNIPIGNMQGVQEKLANMMYQTILIDSGIRYMNSILDSGEKPAVLSAILKQQSTERARKVILDGMDVYGGSGIILGENNFLHKYYQSIPVGITVEGSNTLTRSLIIFGQGLNKSHPYISQIVESLMSNEKSHMFKSLFKKMMLHSTSLFVKATLPCIRPSTKEIWNNNIILFANLSNIVSLMGGALKKEQVISGLMADLFSSCYLSQAVIWDYETRGLKGHLSEEIVLKELNSEFSNTLLRLKYNLPRNLRVLANISCRSNVNCEKGSSFSCDSVEYLCSLMWEDNNIRSHFENQIIVDSGPLKDIRVAVDSPVGSRDELVSKIISVGESELIEADTR